MTPRRYISWAMLTCLALVWGLVVLWAVQFLPRHESASAAACHSEMTGCAPAGSPASALPRQQPDPEPGRPATVAPAPSDPSGLIRIEFHCLDDTASPLCGMALQIRVMDRQHADGRNDKSLTLASDDKGRCAIECEPGRTVRVESEVDGWFLAPREATCTVSQVVGLRFAPAVMLRLRAMFDDGAPVASSGTLSEEAVFAPHGNAIFERTAGYSQGFALSKEGKASIPRVPRDRTLQCLIHVQRAGYANAVFTLSPAQLADPNDIVLIVNRAAGISGLRVTFTGSPAQPGTCRILLESGNRCQDFLIRAGQSEAWETSHLDPQLKYRVTVLGPVAGRSDWIEMVRGEVKEVSLELSASGSLRVCLLDENAEGISGGCVALGNEPISYLARMPNVDRARISGKDGVVTLAGLPPGPLEFSANAWGREPARVSASIRSGACTDAGNVTLLPATGEITIVLTNTRQGMRYRVGIGDRDVVWPVIDGDTFVQQALPLGTYVICISPDPGGPVVSGRVTLTATDPRQTLYLDVARLMPPGGK